MERPNILFIIADDQSYPYAGAYGCGFIKTPGFDRIAADGFLFENAFCNCPQCSPARAAALSGFNMWRLEEASLLAGLFPKNIDVYPEVLERSGYHVGFTGKGWAPGDIAASGRTRNPAGNAYNRILCTPPYNFDGKTDYFENFKIFMDDKPEDAPFCFWFGAQQPHRPYDEGSGLRSGKSLENVVVPPYLPDTAEVRTDLLDYALAIEWYDSHVCRILDHLEIAGLYDSTLIVITADNGMPFPMAKANLYSHSCHVPMAMCWKERSTAMGTALPQIVDEFVSFTDIAPTFCEAARIEPFAAFSGSSILGLIDGKRDPQRDHALCGRERHIHCRPDNIGYPMRSIQTKDFLLVKNYESERWPMGDPISNFGDTDNGMTKQFILDHRQDLAVEPYFRHSFGKRAEYELFDLRSDPYCIDNVAEKEGFQTVREEMLQRMERTLFEEDDPRIRGWGEIFDSYPYFQGPWPWSGQLAGFKEIGAYNQTMLLSAKKKKDCSTPAVAPTRRSGKVPAGRPG